MIQTLIVALLVIGSTGYAAWRLMPAAARRALAVQLLRLPLPAPLAAPLRKAATASSGCGCDGCDHAPAKAAASAKAPQVVTFHPRPKR
jgi:hypothetical protein